MGENAVHKPGADKRTGRDTTCLCYPARVRNNNLYPMHYFLVMMGMMLLSVMQGVSQPVNLPFYEDFSDEWVVPGDADEYDYAAPEGWRYREYEKAHTDWQIIYNWHKPIASDQASHYGNPVGWGTKYKRDSWLITPLISIPSEGNYSLFFKELIDSLTTSNPDLTIKISTNGGYEINDFLENDVLYTVSFDYIDIEVEREIDLSTYAGEDIYLAFVYQIPAQAANTWNIFYVEIKEVFPPVSIDLQNIQPPAGNLWHYHIEEGTLYTPGENNEYDVNEDEEAQLIAAPFSGYTFDRWEVDNGSQTDTYMQARDTLQVMEDVSVQGIFAPYGESLLWRQHRDGAGGIGDYDFSDITSGSSIGTYQSRAYVDDNEDIQKAGERFDGSIFSSINKLIVYGITDGNQTFVPDNEMEFVIRFFSNSIDPAVSADWNSPEYDETLTGKVFDTNINLATGERVFKVEMVLNMDESIDPSGLGYFYIYHPHNNEFRVLKATQKNTGDSNAPLSYRLTNNAVDPTLPEFNLMFELWGERKPMVWEGEIDDKWDTPTNWVGNQVPGLEDNVLVPNVSGASNNNPQIPLSVAATARHIIIESGAALTISAGGTLEIYKDLTINGSLVAAANSTMLFKGSQQHIFNAEAIDFSGILDLEDAVVTVDNALVIQEGGSIVSDNENNGTIVGTLRHHVADAGGSLFLPVGTPDFNRWVKMTYQEGSPGPNNGGFIDIQYLSFVNDNYAPFDDVEGFYGNVLDGEDFDGTTINTLSQAGVWRVGPADVGGVANGTYEIEFLTHGIDHINNPDELSMLKTSDTGTAVWNAPGTLKNSSEHGPGIYWVGRTGVSGYSYWALGSNHNINPLPIELYSFTAQPVGENVLVEWVTATEINNSHFTLERGYRDGTFTPIATVQGAGNSNELLTYQFTDHPDTDQEIIYYRLTQHDFDGQYETFDPIAVQLNPATVRGTLSLYPNPTQDRLNIVVHSPGNTRSDIEIYNLSGRLMHRESMALFHGRNQNVLSLSSLPKGVYMIRVTSPLVVFDVERVVVN